MPSIVPSIKLFASYRMRGLAVSQKNLNLYSGLIVLQFYLSLSGRFWTSDLFYSWDRGVLALVWLQILSVESESD